MKTNNRDGFEFTPDEEMTRKIAEDTEGMKDQIHAARQEQLQGEASCRLCHILRDQFMLDTS